MSNPFGKDGGPVNSVPRNAFDLSFQNNVTLNFGALVPVMCKEVLPGDSFKIDATFGLRFMPTAFPLQTRMRADLHLFYVRDRNLWVDWMDHYGKTKTGLIPPYISPSNSRNRDMFGSCGLADYLGVPTTLVGEYGSYSLIDPSPFLSLPFETPFVSDFRRAFWDGSNPLPPDTCTPIYFRDSDRSFYFNDSSGQPVSFGLPGTGPCKPLDISSPDHCFAIRAFAIDSDLKSRLRHSSGLVRFRVTLPTNGNVGSSQTISLCLVDRDSIVIVKSPLYSAGVPGSSKTVDLSVTISEDAYSRVEGAYLIYTYPSGTSVSNQVSWSSFSSIEFFESSGPSVRDVISVDGSRLPWEIEPISALPFRAYESIYNSFYRDDRNNPFVIDGEKEYNRYLPTQEGGEDRNIYKLHYRNWEQDFLTTAVPTPQQGVAPLVGITSTGVMSIQDPESGQVYQVQAKTSDDADTIVGFDVTETLPKAVTRSLVNYATSGISINDFRNVNAFQRWLETNIRRGFKYRDQIKSHYDVDISYQELDMPEFIGGFSIDVLPQTISQTSQDSPDNPLGSYAGQLYGSGSSKNSVTNYFDEHGFVMAILSVVPVPNYSQLMPKHFWKKDSLDYFSPEFGHIGLQAIPSKEVAPIQLANDSSSNFSTDVFGYQRAWYDYLQSVDEVHGMFRTSLRNFVMNRVFDNKPTLGPSFTVIDPSHLNDVFTVQNIDGVPLDKILGQIYFDIKAKRPIPRFGVPRLE